MIITLQVDIPNLRGLLVRRVHEYARLRQVEVDQGRETPELAGLMVQKYGYGMSDALHEMVGSGADFYREIDQIVASLDAEWKKTAELRWAARPAGLSLPTVTEGQ